MTLNFFLLVCGMSGISKADQKSSASRPDLYPCRVRGVDSALASLCFSFPLLGHDSSCRTLARQTNSGPLLGSMLVQGVRGVGD